MASLDDWLLRPPTVPDPPLPMGRNDQARVLHSRLRRRMLEGTWQEDLTARLQRHLGSTRRVMVGPEDLSGNIFAVLCRELATLHLEPPTIRHNDAEDLSGLLTSLDSAGLWAVMPRYQSYVIGMRDHLMRIGVDDSGALLYRPVPVDLICAATTSSDQPSRPVRLCEARLREDPIRNGEQWWTVDVFDISDPSKPSYRILDSAEKATDLTQDYYPGLPTWPDEWRKADGTPVLPYAIHHAAWSPDRLWDPYAMSEIVEGSLNHAVLLSLWLHLVRDASWPQRYALNARPAGLETGSSDSDSAPRAEVATDPATLLELEQSRDDVAQVLIGQWQAGGDPAVLLQSIEGYSARLGQDAGVAGSDIHRLSGDPRSGYAISLTNEGKRAAQRRFAASMRFGDQDMIALSATMLNRAWGTSYPEGGYSITYQSIPLSPEELEARREHVVGLLDVGLMGRVAAYRDLNPGISVEQAQRDLDAIDAAKDKRDGPADTPDPGVAVGAVPAANTALNGAQVTAALAIVQETAAGRLTPAMAQAMLEQFFNLSAAAAGAILADVGNVKPPAPPPSPFGAPEGKLPADEE